MGTWLLTAAVLTQAVFSQALAASPELEKWMKVERAFAERKLLENISPSGAAQGAVIASPAHHDPDYFYHWIRDAALTMSVPEASARLAEYIRFSRQNQRTTTLTGLGEPKFRADGSAFNEPWGRPQNDGPALRALALMQGLRVNRMDLRKEDQETARQVIQDDLDYVATHWQDSSFDLWEEVKGDHFYTRMVQRRALFEGSAFLSTLRYRQEADKISASLESFWDERAGLIRVTRNRVEGIDYKSSGLDSAVLLAVLHAGTPGLSFSQDDPRVGKTVDKLRQAFESTYGINKNGMNAPGIGRYPEDRYYNGNPWVLATLAFAEIHYRWAKAEKDTAKAAALRETGDAYVERIRRHAFSDGSLSEQFDRETGFMISAPDLTWNYAAFLTALQARTESRIYKTPAPKN